MRQMNLANKYLASLRKREEWLRQKCKELPKDQRSYYGAEASALGWAIANLQHLEDKK